MERTVVVTGASGGIGRATAVAFGREATPSPCSPVARWPGRLPPTSRPQAGPRW